MRMKKGDLSVPALLMMGGALYSMHFGASSMVWPMTWGKESGSSVFIAFIGAFITSLFLPLLAYVALARGQGTYFGLAKRAMPKFGPIFTSVTIIIMGPLYTIPRMSASSWDAICQATGFAPDSSIPIIVFSAFYYALTYWFLAGRSDMMDKVSKFLFPVLILIVVAIIGKGLMTPLGEWQPKTYETPALAYGFTQGYATSELLCALTLGIVVLNNLKGHGVTDERMNKNIIRVGIVGIGLLSLTHLGHMIVGANTGGTIELQYVTLYTQVAFELLGTIGGAIFSIGLVFASLTTAIGISAATAEFCEDASNKKLKYKKSIAIVCIFSAVIGAIGLTNILTYVAPIQDAVYPGAIILVLYYVLMPDCQNKRHLAVCKWGIIVSVFFGVLDGIYTYNNLLNLNLDWFVNLYLKLPFAEWKLAWVPVCAIVMACVYLFSSKKSEDVPVTDCISE